MNTAQAQAPRTKRPALAPPRTPSPTSTLVTPQRVLAAIYAGAAAVIFLWWHNTPDTLHSLSDWLVNAGRITGLLGGYAAVVLLILMARLPVLERVIGADRLARWHAMGGRYTVSLLTAHALLILWGYALMSNRSVTGETADLLTQYPDVLMATVGLGLFIMIGAVSARAARKRMAYETWYYLHLYTYLAIALSFAHQFATGAEFMYSLPARILWSAMYVIAAIALLWNRFIVPIRGYFRHQMRVTHVIKEGPDTISIVVQGKHLDELGAESGHFFRWRFFNSAHWWQSHPYSLSAPPHPKALRITVKALGDHSSDLQDLKPGTRVLAEGPYGAFTAARRSRQRVLLIGGGIGITPLRALFETLPGKPGHITLIYRANTEGDLVLRSELERIARERGAKLHYVLGLPGSKTDAIRADRLAALVPGLAQHEVYMCGPPGLTRAATAALLAAKVPAKHIHNEEFAF